MARVLVIDSSTEDRQQIQDLLAEEHQTEGAEDDRNGLFFLTASPWDVVILAPETGVINGEAIMRHIRELSERPEVVVTTSKRKLETVVDTLRAGAFEFVRKPVVPESLRKAVANAAQVRRLRRDKRKLEFDQRQERQQLEALVEERGVQMRQLFESVPGLLYRMVVDSAGERYFSFLSSNCQEILELSEEVLLREAYRFDALLHPDDAPRFRRARAQAESQQTRFRFEGRFVLRSGRTRWLQCVANPTLRREGNIMWDGIILDSTERNELESQLLLTDRLASVGNMAAAFAHEVNNPLAFMRSNLLQLQKELSGQPASGEVPELVEETLQGLMRIETAVQDLRIFARSSVESAQLVPIREVLDSSLRLATNEIRHRARLRCEYESNAQVWADESNLGQLFLNLLLCVAQSIPDGEAMEYELKVHAWDASGDRVAIEISDNGPGLPLETLERAFEPLESQSVRGGLGLYVCHRIVASLEGQITASQAPEGGSRFRVTLPIGKRGTNVIPFPSPQGAQERPSRILVVDDEELVIKALCRALEGHEVFSAASGRQAIDMIRHDGPFDLVVCDVMMPDLTGADVYDAARQVGAEDRIVFVTGGAFTASAQAFLQSVPNRRIEKPFSRDSIRALLREVR